MKSEIVGGQPSLASARMTLRQTFRRRREEADFKDDRLFERRDIDRATPIATERSPVPPQKSELRPEPLAAVNLAAAVERLALTLERQQRVEGPSLEMRFGGRLNIRLTRGGSGLELAISGDTVATRLARAELPHLLTRLRERGLVVSRADVQSQPIIQSSTPLDIICSSRA